MVSSAAGRRGPRLGADGSAAVRRDHCRQSGPSGNGSGGKNRGRAEFAGSRRVCGRNFHPLRLACADRSLCWRYDADTRRYGNDSGHRARAGRTGGKAAGWGRFGESGREAACRALPGWSRVGVFWAGSRGARSLAASGGFASAWSFCTRSLTTRPTIRSSCSSTWPLACRSWRRTCRSAGRVVEETEVRPGGKSSRSGGDRRGGAVASGESGRSRSDGPPRPPRG